MSELDREVSEKEIDDALEKIVDIDDKEKFDNLTHTISFMARILFNMRKDYLEWLKDYAEFKELVMDVVGIERTDKEKKSIEKLIENSDIKMLYQ